MQKAALLSLVALMALGACTPADSQTASAPAVAKAETEAVVETLTATELAALLKQGKVVLVDVRTPAEFDEARLHGSLNAPIQTFDPASIPMEAERETILYCRSSGRSGRAAKILADHIGGKVRHLEGGIIAWNEAGLPTIPAASDGN